MQSKLGVPAACLCLVVHWFALSALAATRASIRQFREGPVRANDRDDLLLLYLLHTGDISSTLRCTPSGLAKSLLPE